jgi:hypothetical protein
MIILLPPFLAAMLIDSLEFLLVIGFGLVPVLLWLVLSRGEKESRGEGIEGRRNRGEKESRGEGIEGKTASEGRILRAPILEIFDPFLESDKPFVDQVHLRLPLVAFDDQDGEIIQAHDPHACNDTGQERTLDDRHHHDHRYQKDNQKPRHRGSNHPIIGSYQAITPDPCGAANIKTHRPG